MFLYNISLYTLVYRFFTFCFFYLCSFFLISCSGCHEVNSSSSGYEQVNPLLDSKEVKAAMLIQDHVRTLYKKANSSVVRIETEQDVSIPSNLFFRHFFDTPNAKQTKHGLGSGFIFNSNGLIVTNYHVVKNVDRITIKLLDTSSHEALMIGYDEISDLALLKINTQRNIISIEIGNSNNISVGDLVYAIGNPFGFSATLTSGIISSAHQKIKSKDNIPRIQTDAAINPGNSGGPLLDITGKVIGINQMIYSNNGGSVGVGFAIPINYAVSIIEKIKQKVDLKKTN